MDKWVNGTEVAIAEKINTGERKKKVLSRDLVQLKCNKFIIIRGIKFIIIIGQTNRHPKTHKHP